MPDVLFRLLLGHLVGDYLLQNNWMALNKKKNLRVAVVHCLIWTTCVMVAVAPEVGRYALAGSAGWAIHVASFAWRVWCVFLTHFVLDATGLVNLWMLLIRGRSYEFVEEHTQPLPDDKLTLAEEHYLYAYTALVQTVADNTLHLLFVYVLFKVLHIV